MRSVATSTSAASARDTGRDVIRESFLRAQYEEGMRLARASDLIDLRPVGAERPPERYILTLHCRGLVCMGGSDIREGDRFEIGIWFHPGYQRRLDPTKVVTVLVPPNVWHPNVLYTAMCMGNMTCATTLSDLVYQAWEIITYRKWASHDAINPLAAQWARNNQERFPVDPRPLFRRTSSSFEITPLGEPGECY